MISLGSCVRLLLSKVGNSKIYRATVTEQSGKKHTYTGLTSNTFKSRCPVQGKCLENQVIYRATVTEQSGKKHTYTGLTSNTFKSRWGGHNYTFNHEDSNQTTLSSLTHTLREENINYEISWEIVENAKIFNPISGICALCTREKYLIAFAPEGATLNKRSELFSSCRHKRKMLLVKPNHKKTKT